MYRKIIIAYLFAGISFNCITLNRPTVLKEGSYFSFSLGLSSSFNPDKDHCKGFSEGICYNDQGSLIQADMGHFWSRPGIYGGLKVPLFIFFSSIDLYKQFNTVL